MKRIKRKCADKYMRVGMKRNYDRLTRVSQRQDKWPTWRKDVLRHTEKSHFHFQRALWLGVAFIRFTKNVATHQVLSRRRCKRRVVAFESEAM